MTQEKIVRMAQFYSNELIRGGYSAKKFDENAYVPVNITGSNRRPVMEHLVWVANRTIDFALLGQIDVAKQWLGFLQGALWFAGVYTIEEMRRHNAEKDLG